MPMTPLPSNSAPELGPNFKTAVSGQKQKKKRIAPLSVRLSKEQRDQLERDAIGMSLNAYVLSKLFDDDATSKRKRRMPTKRDRAISSALRKFGQCGIVTYLYSQLHAVEDGRLSLPAEQEAELRTACGGLEDIRRDLIEAMGLNA